jgi:hypothetical protein
LLRIKQGGNSGEKVLAKCCVTGNNVCVTALLDILNEKRSEVFGQTLNTDVMSV